MLGNPGVPTKPRPGYEVDEEEETQAQPEWRPAMPSACLRVLSSPRPLDCPLDCPGIQADGGCLTEIVRVANAAKIEWSFDLDRDGRWAYCGPPL